MFAADNELCLHRAMPFDLSFVKLVQACAGAGTTAAELLARLADHAKARGDVVPDHGFTGALSWALPELAKNGHVTEEFSKAKDAFVYSASEEQLKQAQAERTLLASVRDSHRQSTRGR